MGHCPQVIAHGKLSAEGLMAEVNFFYVLYRR